MKPATLALILLASCADAPADVRTAERVRIDLDRRNAETITRYYLGGLLGPEGGDPVAAGLLAVDGDELWLRPAALPSEALAALVDDGDGVLDRDEFDAWAGGLYASARDLPVSIDSLRVDGGWSVDDTAWVAVTITGSPMTRAERRLFISASALRAALGSFAAGRELAYPTGTLLVGEHLDGGRVVETTVKRRRADGFWDFMVFDAAGRLAERTSTAPRALRSPVQCTGCHLGSRLFEPDRSFPGDAPPGPAGPRGIDVPAAWRDAAAATALREHAARPDRVLGPYATIFLGRLKAERAAGRIAAADARLLSALGM